MTDDNKSSLSEGSGNSSKKKLFTGSRVSSIGRGIETGAKIGASLYNKDLAKQNEALANLYGFGAYQMSHRRSRRAIAKQIANRGASGLQHMGSVSEIISQSMHEAEQEASAARWDYEMKSISLDNQQNLMRSRALSTLAQSFTTDAAYKVAEDSENA